MATDCERQRIAENKILAGYLFRRLGAGYQPSVKVMRASAFSASILNFNDIQRRPTERRGEKRLEVSKCWIVDFENWIEAL